MGCHGDEADEKGIHVHGAERFELTPAGIERIDGNGRIAKGDGGIDKSGKESGCQACRDSVAMGFSLGMIELPDHKEDHDEACRKLQD